MKTQKKNNLEEDETNMPLRKHLGQQNRAHILRVFKFLAHINLFLLHHISTEYERSRQVRHSKQITVYVGLW